MGVGSHPLQGVLLGLVQAAGVPNADLLSASRRLVLRACRVWFHRGWQQPVPGDSQLCVLRQSVHPRGPGRRSRPPPSALPPPSPPDSTHLALAHNQPRSLRLHPPTFALAHSQPRFLGLGRRAFRRLPSHGQPQHRRRRRGRRRRGLRSRPSSFALCSHLQPSSPPLSSPSPSPSPLTLTFARHVLKKRRRCGRR